MIISLLSNLVAPLIPSKPPPEHVSDSTIQDWLSKVPDTDDAKLDYVYDEVKSKVEYDLECADSIDTKAGVTLALVGTLLTIISAVIATGPKPIFAAFCSAAIVLLLLAGGYSGLTFTARDWGKAPKPAALVELAASESISAIKKTVIAKWIEEFATNKGTVNFKSGCFNRALLFALCGVSLLGVGIIVSFFVA